MRNTSGPNVMYLLLYVDDMLMANTSISKVKKIKELQGDKFDMKELGLIRKILRMEICKTGVQDCYWLLKHSMCISYLRCLVW